MSKPRPRAILFDLDDTILEYDGSADRVWRSVVAEFAGGTAGLDIERFTAALNEYREWYWGDPERHRRGRLDLPDTANVNPDGIIRRLSELVNFLH